MEYVNVPSSSNIDCQEYQIYWLVMIRWRSHIENK